MLLAPWRHLIRHSPGPQSIHSTLLKCTNAHVSCVTESSQELSLYTQCLCWGLNPRPQQRRDGTTCPRPLTPLGQDKTSAELKPYLMDLTPASASCINRTSVSLSTPPAMWEAITKHSLQEHHHEAFESYVVGMNWGSVSRHVFRDSLFPTKLWSVKSVSFQYQCETL